MEIQEARKLVESNVLSKNPNLTLLDDLTTEYENCFVFYYQSKKFVETGNDNYFLVGQGPVIVSKSTYDVFETCSAHSTEHYINVFNECGHPMAEITNKVQILGWNDGANKVQATKSIKAATGLGLKEAKYHIDSILMNESTIFEAKSIEDAEKIVVQLLEFGFVSKQIWTTCDE